MNQIDYYQNVVTKLTVTLKYMDQNSVFALNIYSIYFMSYSKS